MGGVMGKENLVPELRFPEFVTDWKQYKLGEITSWKSGNTPSKKNAKYWNGNLPWISASSMHDYMLLNSDLTISKEAWDTCAKIANQGSILLLVRGSMLYNRIPFGLACVDVAFNQDVKALTVDDRITAKFMLFWLMHSEHKLLSMVVGTGIGAGKLDTLELKDLEILVPKLKEQQKIANFLTAIDQRITLLKEKKAVLEQYKKSLMQKIFSQEIRLTDDKGNDFPDWEVNKLGEIAEFSKGKGLSKSDISDFGMNKCIRYGELYTRYSEIIDEVHSKTDLDISNYITSQKNDVIIPSSGETQLDIATASCVLNDGIIIGGDLNIIRSEINGVFLAYYLNNFKKHKIAALSQGSSVIHLYATHLKSLKIDIPCQEEQQKIANFLSAIDQKINAMDKQITDSELFKKGLLQRMFD